MPRPTLLVVEPEPVQALSVRKLVLETAKYNVITAHSAAEGLELFRLFPNISAAVLVLDPPSECERVAGEIRKRSPRIPLIALAALTTNKCEHVDYHVSSHQPEELLVLVRSLLGDPQKAEVA